MAGVNYLVTQARLVVAKRFAPRDLGEGHDAKHVGTAQRANTGIALVSLDDVVAKLQVKLDLRRKQLGG